VIVGYRGRSPVIGARAFVAPNATVLGDVVLGDDASIWYGCVLRGDVGAIRIGARTNIQDVSVIHVTGGELDTHVGDDVTVGHRAIIHGCTIDDHVLIGMGAIVMDGARVGSHSLVGAGALVPPGMVIPPGVLAVGAPARVIRPLRDDERASIDESVAHYVEVAKLHR
jgi:carbonic anhydrase/acetyltransferase-like protein (isoleucine patch superfamily)